MFCEEIMREEEINKARAIYYKVFSSFFVYTKDVERYFNLLNLINVLKENPLNDTSANALENISNKLQNDSNILLLQEYDDIFDNPQTSQIRTTASYYHEGVESGKKRVEMQNFLAKTKIRRDEKQYSDYEDNIGFIFTVLNELCELQVKGNSEYKNTIHCIFESILNEFVDEFSKALYEHESSNIYKDVVVVLKAFIEFERLYLEVSRPMARTKIIPNVIEDDISEEEKARRARNKAMKANGPKNAQDEACPVFVTYDVEEDI
ncbi:molecular chaperone TorD family protein [Halarcobacter sp.]|uniref:TorD/DmsD family molecular chaperone n=1 Tax=Halarcobacter sp. TaxID=2321133 RepID=UPI002AA78093|nr:molecular chaperone TorD family protein [Halarcobacter sp.]